MSDLPRFYQGAQGRLDFTALNEAFRRLDALRPLIESAAVSGELRSDIKPLIFPVFANKYEEGKYTWREVLIRPDDTVVLETDEDYEDILLNSQARSGGSSNDKDEDPSDYAILLDPTITFNAGYCLCIVLRRTDASNRHVLLPSRDAASGSNAHIFVTESMLGEKAIDLPDQTVMVMEYSGKLYRRASGGWSDPTEDCLLQDFSYNELNKPSNANAEFFYAPWDAGTIVTPHVVSSGLVYFGTHARLNYQCVSP